MFPYQITVYAQIAKYKMIFARYVGFIQLNFRVWSERLDNEVNKHELICHQTR